MNNDFFVIERAKAQDPAEIWTQDLNTGQMLLPLSHLDPWQRLEDKLH